MPFFGGHVEVTPPSRLVWTNDEGDENGAVTTVTFEERGRETLVVMHDLYPSKKALDDAIASGSTSGSGEQFEQLDQLLVRPGSECGTIMKWSILASAATMRISRDKRRNVEQKLPIPGSSATLTLGLLQGGPSFESNRDHFLLSY
jgi:activator of Hsp90 ATPase-like protein